MYWYWYTRSWPYSFMHSKDSCPRSYLISLRLYCNQSHSAFRPFESSSKLGDLRRKHRCGHFDNSERDCSNAIPVLCAVKSWRWFKHVRETYQAHSRCLCLHKESRNRKSQYCNISHSGIYGHWRSSEHRDINLEFVIASVAVDDL